MTDACDPCTYILASASKTLYTGVTSDVFQRVYQHRNPTQRTFASQYLVNRLVWYEKHSSMDDAIRREKEIKRWRREKKVALIEASNPAWDDLAATWYDHLSKDD